MQPIAIILRDPVLRMIGLATMIFGVFAASLEPYKSLIGIDVFGLSDAAYAGVLTASLLASLVAAIGVGIITDQRAHRRLMALLSVVGSLIGTAIVWLGDTAASFVIAHVVLFPVAATILGQLFAVTRLYTTRLPEPQRDGITSVIRAMFAVPFVVVLPIWGVLFDRGVSVTQLYPALFVVSVLFLALIWRSWPKDDVAPWDEEKSGLGLFASLRELMASYVIWRIFWMGAVHAGSTLMGIILALVFADAEGRSAGDVGLFFGAFVALEICVMLSVGALSSRFRRLHIICVGGLFYALFMVLLPVLADGASVWLLVIPVAIGGGLLYGLSISYLQDLLGRRAGAGASLVTLQRLISEGLATLIFAIGAALGGYAIASFIGAGVIVVGVVMLVILDRDTP